MGFLSRGNLFLGEGLFVVTRLSNQENWSIFPMPLDYAYVDSQQPELPYHICVIRDFKTVSPSQKIAAKSY